MAEYFFLASIRKAFLASFMAGILLPLLGTFAVLRKNAFLGAGIAHIAFAGVTFGFLISYSPLLWGFLFTWLATGFIWHGTRKGILEYELGMGIFFSLAMALALLFLGLLSSYRADALLYLFGSVIATTTQDVAVLAFFTILTIVVFWVFYKEFFYITFHEELAEAGGINVDLFSSILLFFTSSAIVASLKAVGALLVFGLLVIPAASAYQLTYKFGKMIFISIVFGLISSFGGLFASLLLDIPSGAAIVILSFLIFLISLLFSRKGT